MEKSPNSKQWISIIFLFLILAVSTKYIPLFSSIHYRSFFLWAPTLIMLLVVSALLFFNIQLSIEIAPLFSANKNNQARVTFFFVRFLGSALLFYLFVLIDFNKIWASRNNSAFIGKGTLFLIIGSILFFFSKNFSNISKNITENERQKKEVSCKTGGLLLFLFSAISFFLFCAKMGDAGGN